MSISAYGAWDTGLIPAFEHTEGAELTVGVYVRCQGAGNGAWGKIDDAKLNAVPLPLQGGPEGPGADKPAQGF